MVSPPRRLNGRCSDDDLTILPPNLKDIRQFFMTEPDSTPPVAAVRPHVVVSPNGGRTDPYYWLRDDARENPEALAYLRAENAYREQCMQAGKPFENALYQEIVARLKQDDASVPYR